MYEELVQRLRNLSGTDIITEFDEAAYAIDELDTLLDGVRADNEALCETIDMLKKQVFDMSSLIGDYSEKTRWIPATERLPEDCTPVQVCYIGYYSKEIHSDMLACRYGGLWCYWDGEPCSYYPCNVEITHWMPLPEPPKEET